MATLLSRPDELSPKQLLLGMKTNILSRLFYKLISHLKAKDLKQESVQHIFTQIHENKSWGPKEESVSGLGSGISQAQRLIETLPRLFNDFDISSVVDIPCGDFNWMRHVQLDNVKYIGGDIVSSLIEQNTERYSSNNVSFRHLNLLEDQLPEADLVLCRDCLVHFSRHDVFRALKNIARSNSSYLLSTTFPLRARNCEILTGQWTPINLQARPFNFPQPLFLLNEGFQSKTGRYSDKSLALWRIEDIRACIHAPKC